MSDWTIGDAPYPLVRGTEGPRYKVGPLCAVPTCGRLADHAHHIWSRSYMGKPYDWVVVANITLPNLLALCWDHHQDCTGDIGGYDAGIRYEPESGCLYWIVDGNEELELVWGTSQAEPYVTSEPEVCSECGRRKPRRKPDGLPKRAARRKTRFVITCPQDSEEDGWQILREALDNAAELQGRTEHEDYYSAVDGLHWFALNYTPGEDD